MGRKYPVIIGAMVLVLASWVVSEAFSGEGGMHDYEVTALNKDWKKRLNQDVKVAGLVVDQSLRGDIEKLDVEFDIEDAEGGKLAISYKRLLPDPFDYGREVIVEGKVVGKGKLEARNITVKCPSRYQDGAATEEEMPEKYKQSPLTLRAKGAGYGGASDGNEAAQGAGESQPAEPGYQGKKSEVNLPADAPLENGSGGGE